MKWNDQVRCSECGATNEGGVVYCTICGSGLGEAVIDHRGRLLFFATPPVFLALGTLLAWDMSAGGTEFGFSLGLTLSLFFLVCGGGFWLLTRLFGLPIEASMPWRAGMYGLVSLAAAMFPAFPLHELAVGEVSDLTVEQIQQIRLGLLVAVFLPVLLTGLIGMARRGLSGKRGGGERSFSGIEPRLPTTAGPRNLGELLARFGTIIAPVVALGLAIMALAFLPADRRALTKGRFWAELGMGSWALAQIEAALAINPKLGRAHHLKGILLLSGPGTEERLEQAQGHLEQALAIDPANAEFVISLGMVLDRLGDTRRALEIASAAVDLKPHDAILWVHLGDTAVQAGERQRAIEAYQRALERQPHDPRVLNNLAYTMLEAGVATEAALDLALQAVERDPDKIYNLDTLAWAYFKNDRVPEAFQTMTRLRGGAGSMSVEIDFHYAAICEKLGLLSDPVAVYEELRKRPDAGRDTLLLRQIEERLAKVTGVPQVSSSSAALMGEENPFDDDDRQKVLQSPASPGTDLETQELEDPAHEP
jgi:tetratricopeptide (TPR) repeat protein